MAPSGSLNDFVTQFRSGFVRPNLFRVTFTGDNSVITKYNEILSTACKSVQIPGVTFTEKDYFHEGYSHKFVQGADYDPFVMGFLCDGGTRSELIEAFDAWAALIFGEGENNGKFGYRDEFTCDLKVEMLNRDGTVVYTSNLTGVYPTNLSSFDLSFDTPNKILEYEVTFNFLKFI